MKHILLFILFVISLQNNSNIQNQSRLNSYYKDVNHTELYNEMKIIQKKIYANRGRNKITETENEDNFFIKMWYNYGDLTYKDFERYKEYTEIILQLKYPKFKCEFFEKLNLHHCCESGIIFNTIEVGTDCKKIFVSFHEQKIYLLDWTHDTV
jgi:hypothetical protein